MLDSLRGRYLGRLKVPIRKHRETRQVQAHAALSGCTLACAPAARSTVFRTTKRDGGRSPAKTGVVEANVLAVGLLVFRLPAR